MSVFFLHNFFHNETNDRTEKGLVKIPKDTNSWPTSWKEVAYKNYTLFKPILLEKGEKSFLKELLFKRRSNEKHLLENKLSLSKVSYILQCGYGLQQGEKEADRKENRTVPSGGKRYPLEIYVFIFKHVDNCEPGVYHYGVKKHELEPVILKEFSSNEISLLAPQESLQGSFGMICITGVFSRIVNKYGSRGYRYLLIEAGHVAQNMLLAATEKNVSIVPVGGVNEIEVEKALGLNDLNERVVYTLFF